jgi:hypothetical protein
MTTALTSPVPFADPPWHKVSSGHPYITDSHIKLQREIHEYVDANITPNALQWEEAGGVPEAVSLSF